MKNKQGKEEGHETQSMEKIGGLVGFGNNTVISTDFCGTGRGGSGPVDGTGAVFAGDGGKRRCRAAGSTTKHFAAGK